MPEMAERKAKWVRIMKLSRLLLMGRKVMHYVLWSLRSRSSGKRYLRPYSERCEEGVGRYAEKQDHGRPQEGLLDGMKQGLSGRQLFWVAGFIDTCQSATLPLKFADRETSCKSMTICLETQNNITKSQIIHISFPISACYNVHVFMKSRNSISWGDMRQESAAW